VTQKQTVLAMLKAAGPKGVRSDEFYKAYLPRAAGRIYELRDEGNNISSEREGKFVRYHYHGSVGSRAARESVVTHNPRSDSPASGVLNGRVGVGAGVSPPENETGFSSDSDTADLRAASADSDAPKLFEPAPAAYDPWSEAA